MFVQCGPQQTIDRERGRATDHPNRDELLYMRGDRKITFERGSYIDLDLGYKFIPTGITIYFPDVLAWDDSRVLLTDAERAELIEDLKGAYRALDTRLTIQEEHDPRTIIFEAEPKAYRKEPQR